jgi:hypothetical protein
MPSLNSVLIVASLALTAACERPAAPSHTGRPASSPTSLAQADAGASMLAGVANARVAIAQGDRLDASNDVVDALTFAAQLSGQSSSLFPDESPNPGAQGSSGQPRPAGRHGRDQPSSRRTRFDAQVELVSASAALQNGDLQTADADLKAIQDPIPANLVPAVMPLLEADESLDLAIGALAGERPDSLRYQLTNAGRTLRAYNGPSHVADARALAAEIDAALDEPGGLDRVSGARVELWSDRIDGWI